MSLRVLYVYIAYIITWLLWCRCTYYLVFNTTSVKFYTKLLYRLTSTTFVCRISRRNLISLSAVKLIPRSGSIGLMRFTATICPSVRRDAWYTEPHVPSPNNTPLIYFDAISPLFSLVGYEKAGCPRRVTTESAQYKWIQKRNGQIWYQNWYQNRTSIALCNELFTKLKYRFVVMDDSSDDGDQLLPQRQQGCPNGSLRDLLNYLGNFLRLLALVGIISYSIYVQSQASSTHNWDDTRQNGLMESHSCNYATMRLFDVNGYTKTNGTHSNFLPLIVQKSKDHGCISQEIVTKCMSTLLTTDTGMGECMYVWVHGFIYPNKHMHI